MTAAHFLYRQPTITGLASVKTFAAAARGPGVIPGQLDFEALEGDIFNLAVAQRGLMVVGWPSLNLRFRHQLPAPGDRWTGQPFLIPKAERGRQPRRT